MTAAPPFQPGLGMSLLRGPQGAAYQDAREPEGYLPEWHVSPFFASDNQEWAAILRPGYVNGDSPIYSTTYTEQARFGGNFGNNPLSGEPYFSSPVFHRGEPAPARTVTLEIPLYLRPAIPLRGWRSLGRGSGNGEIIPTILRERGVARESDDEVPAKEARQLRAIDLILHQPRVALTSQISFEPGLVTGQTFVRQVLSTRLPQAGDVLRVYSGLYQLPSAPDPLAEQYEEQAYDELKIATVYVMSPRGAAADAEPDGTWVSAVAHRLFWNLHWIPAPIFRDVDISGNPNPLVGLSPLLGGLAAPFVNTFAAAANDLIQQALNRLQARSQAGTWWAPTGGGSLAAPAPLQLPGYDPLDKAARRQTEAWARSIAAQRAQQGLDPAFPYTGLSFPVSRFRV